MIRLKNEAENYFNEKYHEYLLQLKPNRIAKKVNKSPSSSDHVHTIALKKEDIIDLTSSGHIDSIGRQLSKYFYIDDNRIGLDVNDYNRFEEIASKLSEKKEIRNFLSKDFIVEKSFLWFKLKYTGKLDSNSNFIDYLITESKNEIKERKICFPVANIIIEESFELGNIRFDFFKKEQFDEIENEWGKSEDKDNSQSPITKLRKEYQGKVYAEFVITAEEQKCIELAKKETDRAIMVLSCYCGTVFHPEIPAYFERFGKKNIPVCHSLVFEENKLSKIIQKIEIDGVLGWRINKEMIARLNSDGLSIASRLLRKRHLTDLEEIIINAFYLFSRGIFSDTFHDKLVYALVTLETLLLKNTTEPIQSNVGLRLAFLVANDADNRKRIKKFINDAYILRSSFIHHGKRRENISLLKEIQILVFFAIRSVLFNSINYKTQEELLNSIENVILS